MLPARRAAPTFARQSSGLRVGGLAGEWRVGDLEPATKRESGRWGAGCSGLGALLGRKSPPDANAARWSGR
jgi:hypothetical protein